MTPSRARTGGRRALVEHEIYEQATRLFAERGYAGTSFQDIADAVGITRPALYHYVNNKNEILERLVAEVTYDAAAAVQTIAQRTDLAAAAKLREIVMMSVRRQGEFPQRFRLLIRSEADLPAPIADAHSRTKRSVLRSMASVIDSGVADGSFRPVDGRIAALGILGTCNWVAWWYDSAKYSSIDSVASQLADTAVAGLLDPHHDGGITGPNAAIAAIRANLDRLETTLRS